MNAWQHGFDLRAMWFVLLRKLELFAQSVRGFIDREARKIGGELEEHAARLAKVDGAEVIAVDDRCGLESSLQHLRSERELRAVVVDAKRDVVHRSCARLARHESTDGAHIDDRPRGAVSGGEPSSACCISYRPKSQGFGEQSLGFRAVLLPQ